MFGADAIRCRRHSGGGDGYSAKFWRVSITATRATGEPRAQLNEVSFGVSLESQYVQALASSEHGASSAAAMAFDGNTSTSWMVANYATAPHWIQMEFDSPVSFEQFSLRAEYGVAQPRRAPRDFSLLYSDDGLSWHVALVVEDEPAWSSGENRTYIIA